MLILLSYKKLYDWLRGKIDLNIVGNEIGSFKVK